MSFSPTLDPTSGSSVRSPRWGRHLAARAHDDAYLETAPPHVVLAEDDLDSRRLIRQWLWDEGCLVTEVSDGAELSSVIGAYLVGGAEGLGVDAVVSDIRMPGATGMEVLASLRARDPVLPVVLITAFGTRQVHKEAERLGAAVLNKPFDRLRLIHHLGVLFD